MGGFHVKLPHLEEIRTTIKNLIICALSVTLEGKIKAEPLPLSFDSVHL